MKVPVNKSRDRVDVNALTGHALSGVQNEKKSKQPSAAPTPPQSLEPDAVLIPRERVTNTSLPNPSRVSHLTFLHLVAHTGKQHSKHKKVRHPPRVSSCTGEYLSQHDATDESLKSFVKST